ncbi:hypothetical protein [Coraliomargarita akajimensis]|uniref:Porphyranase beta-sandwich domain-containing protein n=1 Tax=Coraliomargarita akajimensis (strain DSM 45221 / IAM 15411 / JCM 23193 / KCTC 12865 / 04OKA010-24) TaxID=583355 RepID=D5ENS5_CORAD|nr:hypothetical protein [Coraliomargarita akajimensis]ADE53584.1 hypothetical protein Caka_0559 [Coraliomargarita akajimensis DSM 45221]
MKHTLILSLASAAAFTGCLKHVESPESTAEQPDYSKPYIVVDPATTRAVQGVSEVDRTRYFALCDGGSYFDRRVENDAMYDYVIHELGANFGRGLGPVKAVKKSLKEDPSRPGYADLSKIKNSKPYQPSEKFLNDLGPNLDVASHGNHNAFPEFMGKFETEYTKRDKSEYLPKNIDAAAELSAAVLKYRHSDFDRPRYYEPLNEPHWDFYNHDHLAKWHLKTMEVVKASNPDVLVGGPCSSVCYFYRSDYKSFNGLRKFIDETNCDLDFYSFHTYDYLRYRDGELKGRLQSGIALEGTLDIVPNYTMNAYGKEMPLVISEHGGYIGSQPKGEYDGELVAAEILKLQYPDADTTTWEYEMKKRSIVNYGHVSSCIANTLAFIDHPHTVQKSVPFLLFNTWNWGPKYYAGLYVPYEYTDKTKWVETDLTAFYKFFRGIDGRRVKALCSDPDLQVRAFVNGSKLFLVVNNQSFEAEQMPLYGIPTAEVDVRRFGRNKDFTTHYEEVTIETPKTLEIAGRESLVLIADYGSDIVATTEVNEVVCYGDSIAQLAKDASFKVKVPTDQAIDYAQLRIGLTRKPESSKEVIVRVNGELVDVPLEDCAERFTDKEYATTKLAYLDPAILQAENTVEVSFPDSDDGAIGTVVIRAAMK